MMQPTWLDNVVQKEIDAGNKDPLKIAQVVANSPRFVDAIKQGLANPPKPGTMGPSYAQVIRQEIEKAVAAV